MQKGGYQKRLLFVYQHRAVNQLIEGGICMDARTCKSCKRLFNYLHGPVICVSCLEKLEEKFKEVKDYIREHPHASLKEISDSTEVSVKQLKNWVREERLKFSDDSPIGIECMNCGTTIKCGKYCESCKGKMINNLSPTVVAAPKEEPKKSSKSKMRFLDV